MKLKHLFFTALLMLSFFVACKQEQKNSTLKEYMIGSWETTYLKIEMPTVNKLDSTSVFEDDFSKTNSRKAQSQYKEDGTFTAWFLHPDGKKVDDINGQWNTQNDSLFVDYLYSGKQVQAWYKIKKIENGFNGTVIYDWDNDGEYDDTLFMKTKRIK